MKKTVVLVATLLMSAFAISGASAQNSELRIKEPARTLFEKHGFMQLQGGVAHTIGEAPFGDLLSPAASLQLGYKFSPGFATRLGATGWQAKGALVSPSQHYKFNYVEANVDLMWDIINSFNFNPDRVVNPYLFVGGGAAFGIKNDEAAQLEKSKMELFWEPTKTMWAARAGLGIDFRLSDRVSLMIEGNVNMFPDDFNSKKGDVLDFQINALAGIKLNFGPTYTRTEPIYYEPEPAPAPKPAPAPVKKEEPKPAPAPVVKELPELPSIHFAFDSDKVDEVKYAAELAEIVRILKEFSDKQIRIIGYTDHTGDATYNDGLSVRRAEAVKAYLVAQGISADRLAVIGEGEDPKTSGDAAFTIQARRVEVKK